MLARSGSFSRARIKFDKFKNLSCLLLASLNCIMTSFCLAHERGNPI